MGQAFKVRLGASTPQVRACREFSKVSRNFVGSWPSGGAMDVSTSARTATTSAPTASGSTSAPAAASGARTATAPGRAGGPPTPFAGLLAAARGRPGKGGAGIAGGPAGDASMAALTGKALEGEGLGAPHAVGRRKAKGTTEGDDELERDAASASAAPIGEEADGETAGRRGRSTDESEWLDPSARQLAQLAPPGTLGNPVDVTSTQSGEPVRARSLEELLPALVRRIAWAGDRHRGTVRLELGAGAYAGTTVLVHADGGRVRVEIGGSEGPELDRLRARLDARLRGHGLDVESVT